ncbi:MAG TPA: B-box zinc finger protein, partial [Candidatus Dormibacteraeota bacterium]|nr:B-box zinc finger protein [Candidatus Dormibacteraeota bacterium]
MKVECSCGVKYEFEIRPEMRDRPVALVCPACGLDASGFVDGLIRRELGQSVTPTGTPVPALNAPPALTGPGTSPPVDPPPVASVRLARASSMRGGQAAPVDSAEATACPKHPGNLASSKCYICSKPICPKCMELFGYVCSPLCKAKAESHGVHVPVYAGQKSRVEARRWRAVVYSSSAVGILLVLLLGLWGWYAWFGCHPKSIFSVRFPDPAYSGRSALAGKHRDQLVFLHGPVLARYDLTSGKEIWSRRIVDQGLIERAVARQIQATQAIINKANNEAWENVPKMPSADSLARTMERQVTSALNLLVRGESVWLISPDKVSQYDWQTGNSLHELAVQPGFGEALARGDELLFVGNESGKPVANHINLITGASRTEDVSESDAKLLSDQRGRPANSANAAGA